MGVQEGVNQLKGGVGNHSFYKTKDWYAESSRPLCINLGIGEEGN